MFEADDFKGPGGNLLPKYSFENGNANGENIDEPSTTDNLDEKTGNHGQSNGSIIKALIDPRSKAPIDLIQEDFPATPSAVYSKRLLANAEGRFDQDLDGDNQFAEDPLLAAAASAHHQQEGNAANRSANSPARHMGRTGTGSNDENNKTANKPSAGGSDSTGLDRVLQQLYVSDENRAAAEASGAPAPIIPIPSSGGLGRDRNSSNRQPVLQVPAGSSLSANSQAFQAGSDQAQAQQAQMYRGQQAQAQAQAGMVMGPQGMMPPVPYMHAAAAAGGPNGPQDAHQYYMQQPVYLDQNGNPVYYRVGNPNAPYQQGEMMYGGHDGSNPEMPVAYIPYAGQPIGYDAQGQPVFMGGPGVQQAVDSNGVMRRVVYNPVAGGQQYVMPNGGRGPGGQVPGQPMMMQGQGQYGMMMPGREDGGMFHGHPRDGMRMGMDGMGRGLRRDGMGMDMRRDDYRRRDDRGRDDRNREERDRREREREYGMRGGVGANPVRDPLVDEFRSTYGKSRQWGLCDLLGHVVAFCQDQHGSRFIQQRLEVCTDVDKQLIFDEIIPSAHLLMTDVFGNYVLQKLFEYGTPEQCETLALLLSGQAVQLSMQMYGCRVVQKALEYVSTQRLIALVSEFESPPVLLRCVHDSNGNHVIQKCIEIVSRVAKEAATPELSEYLSSRIQFIIDAFQGRVKELSSHPYGCRVVQRILEHCSNPQKAVILEELRQCCAELVQDCYGNYVIQFVMQHGWEADRAVLIREVQNHLLEFSQHKFASNVVEKCLQYASKRDRDEMIWTIINVTFDLNNPVDAKTGHCVLESMVRDPYANYVVQKVIDVSDERQRGAIMRYVKENINQLRRYTYGKHIIVRLEKLTNEKF